MSVVGVTGVELPGSVFELFCLYVVHSIYSFRINTCDHLVGLVVKVSASGVEDLGFESHLRWDFSGSSHTSDLKIGTPVATLPGAWH